MMSGLDRIIEKINADSLASCREIADQAQKKAQDIAEDANAHAEKAYSDIIADAEKKAQSILNMSEANISGIARRAELSAKVEAVDAAIEAAYDAMCNMGADDYFAALEKLAATGLIFHCGCSRRDIAAAAAVAGAGDEPRCVGHCRERRVDPAQAAVRASLRDLAPMCLRDRSGREIRFDPAVHTDVVVRRRDGVIAYPLAVVVDDAAQGISDVVRGGDLLPSTAWQLALQQALTLPTPRYLHLPVVTEPDGSKLAKSRRSLPLDPAAAPAQLCRALALLGQPAPPAPCRGTLEALWDWAIARWDPQAATARAEVRA